MSDYAYPNPSVNYPNGETEYGSYGLTKRELFAAMFMQASLSSPALLQVITASDIDTGDAADRCAKASIRFANALIKQLDDTN